MIVTSKRKSSAEQIKIKSLNLAKCILGKNQENNKLVLLDFLDEVCVHQDKTQLVFTSVDIVKILKENCELSREDERFIQHEITRRISGAESFILSGRIEFFLDENKNRVRQDSAYVRIYTPDPSLFQEKFMLDI